MIKVEERVIRLQQRRAVVATLKSIVIDMFENGVDIHLRSQDDVVRCVQEITRDVCKDDHNFDRYPTRELVLQLIEEFIECL